MELLDYKELMNDVFELESKLFMQMNSYRLIEQKCNTKCLNSDERKLIHVDIHYVFTRLIRIIKNACPNLTDEDVLFCYLKRVGLKNLIASRCIGGISRQSVNQRKYRIKKKMKEAGCAHLLDIIFPPDN